MGFDPLHAENWYSVKREQLMSFKVLLARRVRLLSVGCFVVFYSLTQYLMSLLLSQGASSILKAYGGSVGRAISNIFPNLGFNIRSYYRLHCKYLSIVTISSPSPHTEISGHPSRYWRVPENRRDFFDELSRKLGFDALIAENWYTLAKSQVHAEKVLTFKISLFSIIHCLFILMR